MPPLLEGERLLYFVHPRFEWMLRARSESLLQPGEWCLQLCAHRASPPQVRVHILRKQLCKIAHFIIDRGDGSVQLVHCCQELACAQHELGVGFELVFHALDGLNQGSHSDELWRGLPQQGGIQKLRRRAQHALRPACRTAESAVSHGGCCNASCEEEERSDNVEALRYKPCALLLLHCAAATAARATNRPTKRGPQEEEQCQCNEDRQGLERNIQVYVYQQRVGEARVTLSGPIQQICRQYRTAITAPTAIRLVSKELSKAL
mmetsp:Transcript_91491/g.261950  ORF Transcript_91491/g.261950 Transcript_91491/m.261950 type:complete len:263 (+) Transcript_91491:1370-2158(+)